MLQKPRWTGALQRLMPESSSNIFTRLYLVDMTLGVKHVLVWGFLIFALGALCAGLSPSISVLILARSVQGIAGAILISSLYALVGLKVPVERRGSAFGLISASAALGISMGTLLGGVTPCGNLRASSVPSRFPRRIPFKGPASGRDSDRENLCNETRIK